MRQDPDSVRPSENWAFASRLIGLHPSPIVITVGTPIFPLNTPNLGNDLMDGQEEVVVEKRAQLEDASGSPVEADCLLGEILFIPPVSRADKGNWELSWLEITDEPVHGELGRSADKAGDLHRLVLPSSLGDNDVVADVMEWE
ncbi:hypothetical protein ACFX2F_004499 [Malus domestica]